jgi:MFS superfamily sulfate permease-like transporter
MAAASPPPKTDLTGLREHWRNDLIAGLSVSLVALPLALGIAMAAGAPPIAGLVSAIVGGLVTTFLRGTHVAINGPGNGLIVIVAGAFAALGGPGAFPHVLGAVVVAGALQVVLGLLRLGKLADLVPSAVIQGMLAAIGLIIVGKQLHVLFGHRSTSSDPIEVYRELPETVLHMNPFVAAIGVVSVLVLVVHPRVERKLVHFVPAPLWVVAFAVPMVLAFNFVQPHTAHLFGRSYHVGPELLVSIPEDLAGSLARPSFSRIGEPAFWRVVLTFTLVSSIESLVSVKAIDKLDPYGRRGRLDRDLVAVGLSSALSGLLGGLPVLTVIARSSVNVNHGAKTGWSNFFHGLLLLASVVLLSPVLQEIPLAALAGILVYTGYTLAAPRVVKDALRKGPDHFLIFGVTVAATLTWGLLWGIFVGLAAELLAHLVLLGLPPGESLARLWRTRIHRVQRADEPLVLQVEGVASYPTILRLRPALEAAAEREHVILDFSRTLLVDTTVLEYCHELGRRHERDAPRGRFEVIGLESHHALSDHPDALHVSARPLRTRRLTPRQQRIRALAEARGWALDAQRSWDPDDLDGFHFFRTHPLEYRDLEVRGHYTIDGTEVAWKLLDVTFDEGVLVPQVYHTTAQVLWLPEPLPVFVLERESLLDRVLELAGFENIELEHFTKLSRRFVLQSPDEASIRLFMTPALQRFFEAEEIYHVESNGEALVVFKGMRLASPHEVERMIGFSERLARQLVKGR